MVYKKHTTKILADFVVFLHSLFVLFMSVGFLYALFTGKIFTTVWGKIYFFSFLLVGIQQVLIKGCFLTIIEKNLRKKINPDLPYRNTFLAQYIPFIVGKGLSQKQVVSLHLSIAALLGLTILFS